MNDLFNFYIVNLKVCNDYRFLFSIFPSNISDMKQVCPLEYVHSGISSHLTLEYVKKKSWFIPVVLRSTPQIMVLQAEQVNSGGSTSLTECIQDQTDVC